MAGESVQQLLAQLTGETTYENSVEIYSQWAGLATTDETSSDDSLYRLVNQKLVVGNKSAQVEESLEATLRKGGADGECVEQQLLQSGLGGWS